MTHDMTPTYHDCLHAGMTQSETAKARGVTRSAVGKWAKRNGLKFKRHFVLRNEYKKCLDAGMTQAEAATELGVTAGCVCAWARRNGVRFKPVYMTARDIPADKRREYLTLTRIDGLTQAEALEALGLEAPHAD